MTNPIFITSPSNVLTGDAARVALETTNDSAYETPGKGVLSVPLERWQMAQQYERETWLTAGGLTATEDRNTEHANQFDGYAALPEDLEGVIEIGCGPFTNVREILNRGHIAYRSITLLDPLAKEYQANHPNCAYRDGFLCGLVAVLETVAIEDYATDITFDTVVMVNTLPHCQDAMKVFAWIRRKLKQGGHLVFGEPARDIDTLTTYDQGHPLSYNQGVIDDFLKGFKEKYRRDNYFIGVKK